MCVSKFTCIHAWTVSLCPQQSVGTSSPPRWRNGGGKSAAISPRNLFSVLNVTSTVGFIVSPCEKSSELHRMYKG